MLRLDIGSESNLSVWGQILKALLSFLPFSFLFTVESKHTLQEGELGVIGRSHPSLEELWEVFPFLIRREGHSPPSCLGHGYGIIYIMCILRLGEITKAITEANVNTERLLTQF